MSATPTREQLVQEAKESEHFHLYDDMIECMKKVIALGTPLNREERTVLYVAYRGAISSKREEIFQDPKKESLWKEALEICNDCLSVLDRDLIPTSNEAETTILYNKLKGDFHRYRSEVLPTEQERLSARESYKKAADLAAQHLPITDPLRLNVCLNWGVFEYELMGERDLGFKISKEAFDEALPHLLSLNEDQYKETTFVLEFLRQNFVGWAMAEGRDLGAPPSAPQDEQQKQQQQKLLPDSRSNANTNPNLIACC
jgi:hypothetical protein